MSYKGSDLSNDFKVFFRAEKKRISKALTELGCTKIEMDYGFYFFSGFFTSESGQIYYLMVHIDNRPIEYKQILFRTAKDYKDYTGGSNQYIDKNDLENIRLK